MKQPTHGELNRLRYSPNDFLFNIWKKMCESGLSKNTSAFIHHASKACWDMDNGLVFKNLMNAVQNYQIDSSFIFLIVAVVIVNRSTDILQVIFVKTVE